MGKENVVHMYNGALLSYKEQNLVFAKNWMQMETLTLNKISQTQANTICPHAECRFKMKTILNLKRRTNFFLWKKKGATGDKGE